MGLLQVQIEMDKNAGQTFKTMMDSGHQFMEQGNS